MPPVYDGGGSCFFGSLALFFVGEKWIKEGPVVELALSDLNVVCPFRERTTKGALGRRGVQANGSFRKPLARFACLPKQLMPSAYFCWGRKNCVC